MTEEIIIDGVNIAGCEFCKPNPLYKIEYACHCRGYIQDDGLHVHLSCEHNPNCYYKQLKRLEQENFALTQESQQKSQTICELEQENKELKEKLDKEEYNVCCECTNIQNQNDTYRSALEEIREIIRADCKRCTAECDCDDDCTRHKIKIKINEVLNV